MVGFVRGALEELIADRADTKAIAAAVAGWIRHSEAVDMSGEAIEVKDPQAETLKEFAIKAKSMGSAPFLGRFLGPRFASNEAFRKQVDEYLKQIEDEGVRDVLKSFR